MEIGELTILWLTTNTRAEQPVLLRGSRGSAPHHLAAACLTTAWISVSCVSISCRFLRNTRRAEVRVGCGGMGWGGGVVGWRAGAGWGWGICATRRDPARTHGAPQGGGAYRRSVSSFFSSSSICRGRSRAVRAVRHALGLGVGGQGNAHGKAAQGVVGSHSARSARARGVACCLYAAGNWRATRAGEPG